MNKFQLFSVLGVALLFPSVGSAETETKSPEAGEMITVTGKVMDTDDNWLNDVKVSLKPTKVKTLTDPNGDFVLEFASDEKLKPNNRGILATLVFEKEGHLAANVRIRNMDFFSKGKPLEVKMKPDPMVEGIVGFSTPMSTVNGMDKESKGNAEFHVYIPESVEKVRAAFYLSRHGMGNIVHPILQKFVEEEKVALVAMYGEPVQRGLMDVSLMDKQFAKVWQECAQTDHPKGRRLLDAFCRSS